jgi:capsular polysaccharide transport system permease protein
VKPFRFQGASVFGRFYFWDNRCYHAIVAGANHHSLSLNMPPEAPDVWADIIQPIEISRPVPLRAAARPPGHRRGIWRLCLSFVLLVLLPTLLTGGYLGFIAAHRYVSEARFLVRKPNAPGRASGQALSIEEGPKSFGQDDAYAVRDFMLSRDAMSLLLRNADFRAAVARAGDDWYWRFPGLFNGRHDEDLYRYFGSLVSVDYESSTGVTVLRVQAFQPADAQRIAQVLLSGGEALMNRLNERARIDAVQVAEAEVARSRAEVLRAEDRLTEYRDREAMVDPTQFSKTVLDTIGKLEEQLVDTAAQLEVTRKASPNSPQIPPLDGRVRALRNQIERERATLAGSDGSLAPKIGEYERLWLLREFAQKTFVSALNLREAARLDAERQQGYIEEVVAPGLADKAIYPHRIRWIGGVFLFGLALFWMFRPSAPPVARPVARYA